MKKTELFRTSQSWDGVQLPDYPAGRPELVSVKIEIPAGQKLSWHDHPVINFPFLADIGKFCYIRPREFVIIAATRTEKGPSEI